MSYDSIEYLVRDHSPVISNTGSRTTMFNVQSEADLADVEIAMLYVGAVDLGTGTDDRPVDVGCVARIGTDEQETVN